MRSSYDDFVKGLSEITLRSFNMNMVDDRKTIIYIYALLELKTLQSFFQIEK